MVTTTSYGSWNDHYQGSCARLSDAIGLALGEPYADYDMAQIEVEYRQAINDALPYGVRLVGDEFIGPYHDKDKTWDGELDIKQILLDLDDTFWEIVEHRAVRRISEMHPDELVVGTAVPIRLCNLTPFAKGTDNPNCCAITGGIIDYVGKEYVCLWLPKTDEFTAVSRVDRDGFWVEGRWYNEYDDYYDNL